MLGNLEKIQDCGLKRDMKYFHWNNYAIIFRLFENNHVSGQFKF